MLHMLMAYKRRGYVTSVEAFPLPESIGTHDMIKKAQAARVWVRAAHDAPMRDWKEGT